MASLLQQLSPTYILVLISTLGLLLSDSTATITRFPQNAIVVQGENATMRCSSDAGTNRITWTRDGNVITTLCTSHFPDFEIASAPGSINDCDIKVLGRQFDYINGPYVCADGVIPDALAMLIVLNSEPVCRPVIARSAVAENESVDFACSVAYKWRPINLNTFPLIDVSFGWEGVAETPTTRRLSSSQPGGSEEANMTVVGAKRPSIPAQKCTIRFTFAPRPQLQTRFAFAVNPLSRTCQTDPIPVQHCPSSVWVSPSSGPYEVGDVLTCVSDGYPAPSYTWTDSDGQIVSTGPSIILNQNDGGQR